MSCWQKLVDVAKYLAKLDDFVIWGGLISEKSQIPRVVLFELLLKIMLSAANSVCGVCVLSSVHGPTACLMGVDRVAGPHPSAGPAQRAVGAQQLRGAAVAVGHHAAGQGGSGFRVRVGVRTKHRLVSYEYDNCRWCSAVKLTIPLLSASLRNRWPPMHTFCYDARPLSCADCCSRQHHAMPMFQSRSCSLFKTCRAPPPSDRLLAEQKRFFTSAGGAGALRGEALHAGAALVAGARRPRRG